ncbi:M50 family metallopeptidase [Propioniciclava soli]|uniref:M50 family metallopeptidase n=1 Tax=Propioniciclava soli TaxID=2775081 RepID=A0ABZ3C5E4_9ACTN
MLTDLWQRASATQPPLPWAWTVAWAVVALALVAAPQGWRVVRHLVTLIHEAGHALVAALAGRQLGGIRLHSDSSGVTLSRGRPRGLGMVATVFAGYPAPAVVGLAGAWLLGVGHAAGVLWALVLTCALMLVLIRNWYGLWVVLVTGLGVAALSWFAPADVLSSAAHLLVWVLLFAAPRSLVNLQRARHSRADRTSDPDQLARLTWLPAWCWVGCFWAVCLAALGVAIWQLVPGAQGS